MKGYVDALKSLLGAALGGSGENEESDEGVERTSGEEGFLPLGDGDFLSLEETFEGVHIFGATGSGKTTGSGQAIALRLLRAGFGGVVLTAKSDELETWRRYLGATGRLADLCVLEPGGEFAFNFLEYERGIAAKILSKRGSKERMLTDNLVALFCAVMEVSQRSSGSGNQEAYWIQSLKQLLRNAIDLLALANQPISFQNLYNVITSAPTQLSYVEDEGNEACRVWRENSFCYQAVGTAIARLQKAPEGVDVNVLSLVNAYWMQEFPSLAEETRSVIVSYFTGIADCFLRGVLRELFSPEEGSRLRQLDPEQSHKGKIILLNLPVKEFNELGQFAQVLYKFVWQRATERRDLNEAGQRPVFLWADEAQFFVNSQDMMFQTTARSKRSATIYLTQNISNYYAVMPGEKGKAETDSLLGNFQTKVLHANGDSVTNKWAAELIGQDWTVRETTTSSISNREQSSSTQFGANSQQMLAYQVLPKRFTTLRKGGKNNDFKVDAFIFQGGRAWAGGKNFKPVTFTQEFLSESGPSEPTESRSLLC